MKILSEKRGLKMQKLSIAGYDVNILDKDELSRVKEILMAEIERMKDLIRHLEFEDAAGNKHDGAAFFESAQGFEYMIGNIPFKENFRFTDGYISRLDMLIEQQPDLFEFHFLRARIYLAALVPREQLLFAARESIEKDHTLSSLKEDMLQKYEIMKQGLLRAAELYNKFLENQNYPPLNSYMTDILSKLASCYRRHAAFLVRSDPQPASSKEKIQEVAELSMHSHGIFEKLMQRAIFFQKESVAVVLANYANALKIAPADKEKGLRFYKEAKKILGNLPDIEEGIDFFQSQHS
jgi:hypothetical protein